MGNLPGHLGDRQPVDADSARDYCRLADIVASLSLGESAHLVGISNGAHSSHRAVYINYDAP